MASSIPSFGSLRVLQKDLLLDDPSEASYLGIILVDSPISDLQDYH